MPEGVEPKASQPFIVRSLAGGIVGAPNGSFVVAEWREPAAQSELPTPVAPLHVHYEDDEAWYVLEGTLRFKLGEQEVDAPAGTVVYAPRGVPHTYWNPGRSAARYLLIMTPNTYRLIEELHAGPRRDVEATRALYRKYRCDLLPE